MYKVFKQHTQVNFTKGYDRIIKYIVIHYTGNITDTAKANANYFKTVNRGASAHYFVDSNDVYQVVDDKDVAWAVGKNYGSNNLFGVVTNDNSISIEMCSTNGIIADATFNNTIDLVKELMLKYNISADNVVRHYDVCSKQCPAWYGWGTRPNDSGIIWKNFKNKLINNSKPIPYPHYRGNIEDVGWDKVCGAGETCGTVGKSKRLEAIKIDYPDTEIQASAHIQKLGTINYGKITKDTIIGTVDKGLRLEALWLKGKIQFRVHIQGIGWTNWVNASKGQWLGTVGLSKRIEAIEIKRL